MAPNIRLAYECGSSSGDDPRLFHNPFRIPSRSLVDETCGMLSCPVSSVYVADKDGHVTMRE